MTDLSSMPRRELQELAKEHDIKANLKNEELIAALTPLLAKAAEKPAQEEPAKQEEAAKEEKEEAAPAAAAAAAAEVTPAAEEPEASNKRALDNAASEPAAKKVKVDEPASATPTPGKTTGRCKWFDATKGFGFIMREGAEDVFVHQSCITCRPGFKGLADSEEIEFDISTEENGRLRAANVTAVGGGPTMGVQDPNLAIPLGNPAAPEPARPKVFPPHSTEPLADGLHQGTVKWFNPSKGFGFVTPIDESDDVFVHQSNLLMAAGAFRSLAEGENVEFKVVMAEDNSGKAKRKAVEVTGPGGNPVVGQPRPQPVVAAPAYGAYGAYPGYAAPPAASPYAASPYGAQRPPAAAAPAADPYAAYYASPEYAAQYAQYQAAYYAQQQAAGAPPS